MRRILVLLAAIAVVAMLATGCGSSSSSSSSSGGSGSEGSSSTVSSETDSGSGEEGGVTLDIGEGKTITTDTTKPKIALFGTSGNLYLNAYADGVKEASEKDGVEVTSYDSKFDPKVQLEQIQNVLQQGGFDAFVVVPLDGNILCPVLTNQAPSQDIPVFTSLTVICNRALEPEGEKLWAPGTVSQIQDDSTYTEDEKWVDQVIERLEGKQVVAMLQSPPGISVHEAFEKAMEYGKEQSSDFDLKYEIDTDQTTADCLAKVQTLLQAHPDVEVILSNYSDCTVGALRAIKAAGKTGEVRVFDVGGSHQSFEAIEKGELEGTTLHTPHDNGARAIETVVEAFEGKKVPRYVGVYPKGITLATSPLFIDKENVHEYEPQY
jgi:ribose transport system substrate-binding protein